MSPFFNATGSAGRSSLFQRFLDSLPAAQARGLVEGERRYLRTCTLGGSGELRIAAARDFAESMIGFEDRPAGRTVNA